MRHRVRALCSTLVITFGLGTALAADASAGDGQPVWPVERVSVTREGAQALGFSDSPSVSADGRFIAFTSGAPNLVSGITNGVDDIFVRDLVEDTIERVSVAGDGSEANALSSDPAISADGRYVAFGSLASSLVPDDTNGTWDIFVHDRETKNTERVSVASDGTEGNQMSAARGLGPAISGDGRFVVFDSRAQNLDNRKAHFGWDVFLHDRETGETEMISLSSDGRPSNTDVLHSDISADGRHVVFHSASHILDPPAPNGVVDVFLLDRETDEVRRVSKGNGGQEGNWHSGFPTISADGSVVAYRSQATSLAPEVRTPVWDIFVYDTDAGRTERVSISSTGQEPASQVTFPALSADGRYVAYQTTAANIAPDIGNNRADVFVHDRVTRATERISYTSTGEEPDHNSVRPVLSWDGRTLVFDSFARNMVPDKTNMTSDVYIHERGPALGVDRVRAVRLGDEVTVTGRVNFEGQVLADAQAARTEDPVVAHLGGELIGVQLVARPQQEDLLARLSLEHLPGFRVEGLLGAASCEFIGCPHSVGGGPLVFYALAFTLDGVTYEARAQRPWTEGNPFAVTPRLELHRCEDGCERIADLQGATGTTGDEILLSLPLGSLGLEPGAELSDMRAYAAQGHIDDDPERILSQVELPDVTVPGAALQLELPNGESAGAELLPLQRFTATLDAATLADGPFTVRAEACVGTACTTATIPGVVERKDTAIELLVRGRGLSMTLEARLTELDAPQNPIAGRTIEFYSDSELVGPKVTDANGVATVPVPPGHRGANRTYEAVFEGDDLYRASSDQRPGRGGEDDTEGTWSSASRPHRGVVLFR